MMKKLSIGDIFYRSLMWILMAVSVIPLIWVIRTAFRTVSTHTGKYPSRI